MYPMFWVQMGKSRRGNVRKNKEFTSKKENQQKLLPPNLVA